MDIKEIYNTMEYGPAPESAAAAIEYLENHQRKFKLFIDGKFVEPISAKFEKTYNPANQEFLAEIAEAGKEDVDLAVKAANNALPNWVKIGGFQRAKYLYAIARQLQKHSRLFAVLETLDNGKPIRETRDIDIPIAIRHFYHHAGWARLMDTEMKDYEAVGVIGQIIPWNFPLMMLAWKIAPALAMGNTVVLKPAELTSLSALFFAEICEKVGLPKGVVNIVTGSGTVAGSALVNHPDIQKVAFTGSTNVGKILRRETAGSGKKLSLELGGKSPFIVFEDADLDAAVEGVVDAIWFNQGQVCCAGSRLLVQESVAEKLYAKLKTRMAKLRIGDPMDKSIDMGAIVSDNQLKTIKKLVKIGVEEGCELFQCENDAPENGNFYPPTLFTNVATTSTIAQEEIFGPVLVAMTFRSHNEAVALANNTKYGLAASIWTENINIALDIAPKIKAGSIWINCTNQFDASSGFGGYRESGFGREGGKEGLYEYVKPKLNKEFSDKPIEEPRTKRQESRDENKKRTTDIDRTAKFYINGKQARPDGGYSLDVLDSYGNKIGEVGEGNRKDLRNAVEAARNEKSWSGMTGHSRAQVLYYLAENLSYRTEEFAERIASQTNQSLKSAEDEVEKSIERIYYYAAMADKYDGKAHSTVQRMTTLAMPEAVGVMAIICPIENPLLGFISTTIPAIAMGNTVVVVPSEKSPLSATDFYQILETSDVPAGTVNIVTGNQVELSTELAKHYDVDGIWNFGKADCKTIETLAAESMKRSWCMYGKHRNWMLAEQGEGEEFLRHATEIKNIWIPYGA